jgi:sortase A
MNALFPDEPNDKDHTDTGYLLPRSEHRITPGDNPAVELIRRKIDALYGDEPNARKELREAEASRPRSKHQDFMHHLSTTGKSLAEIQSAWHAYYVKLPDDEKREVWQEFYAANSRTPSPHTRFVQQRSATTKPHLYVPLPQAVPQYQAAHATATMQQPYPQQPVVVVAEHETPTPHRPPDRRSAATIRKQVLKHVRASNSSQIKAKQHLQSLAFGLGLGTLVVLIFLFSFFNEVVIAPFIQPASHAEATPIILSQGSLAPNATPEVIIPKINVQLPTIYGTSVNENDVENSLEEGVVHYSSTSVPGQQGNAAFFGHSSNNIFNKGKYKFAFVLLHELVPGDIFYLTYNGKVYTYRVFQKQVVEPTETWVLNPVAGKTATAALITCDPPGTSLHRLVVWGEQIDPDPNANAALPTPSAATQQPTKLASNGPTLLSRFWHWATPW